MFTEVGSGRNQRVVNVPRARGAMSGDAFLRARAFETGIIRFARPVGGDENVARTWMVPSRDVERQRARHASPREDRADLGPLLQRGLDRRHPSLIGLPEMDRIF